MRKSIFTGVIRISFVGWVLLVSSSCSSINGAWYHQTDSETSSLYLAVVYAGKADSLIGGRVNIAGNHGWDCTGNEAVSPGSLVLLWLPTLEQPNCRTVVPVDAELVFRRRTLSVEVSRALPTALSESWLGCRSQLPDRKIEKDELPKNLTDAEARKWEHERNQSNRIYARLEQREASNKKVSALNCEYINRMLPGQLGMSPDD